ncbi:MAG: radical SAM protein [Smithella sp.]
MARILLVEPDNDNKYPPIGLMKIASYHKSKGDIVEFYKGKAPYILINKMDRVYITTLFTFYYHHTIDTIIHYSNYINGNKIYIGGIAATLLQHDFFKDTGLKNVIVGQLTDSSIIGYEDHINIDNLPLDYDILDDISYQYPAGDNFFIYTTRGCPRACNFCAVSTLEPKFKETNNIIEQITSIREKYGDKRNILIMDNNILYSEKLEDIVTNLISLGFAKENRTYIKPNSFEIIMGKIRRRQAAGNSWIQQEELLCEYLRQFKRKVTAKNTSEQFSDILNEINSADNKYEILFKYENILIEIIERYRYKKPLPRYIDFNQGVDVRLLNKKKMKLLSIISIKPFRLAYDNVNMTKKYTKAFQMAYDYGIRYFSNYLLYNYKDSPNDLWRRLHKNVQLYKEKPDIQAFSFPMKYAPIDRCDRNFIGKKWNKKFLSAINVIINVTRGVVAKEMDFFYKAYGNSEDEFIKILFMPNEFIKHRLFFEQKGYINLWSKCYNKLNDKEKCDLALLLSGEQDKNLTISKNIEKILPFYKITKNAASRNYLNLLNKNVELLGNTRLQHGI